MKAILLAAGFARRFGSQKLLASLPDGRCVIEAAAQNLFDALGRENVIAVVGGEEALISVLDKCGCEIVVNGEAENGMGSSIATGIRASQNAAGWLIALGDMPHVSPDTIALVAEALKRGSGIVIPTFKGARGHPVAFAMEFREALVALRGDQGARNVVAAMEAADPRRITLLPVVDAGVLADIDTPEDLRLPKVTHQT
jgi:molybdenum cofactor cytidylyltransferase